MLSLLALENSTASKKVRRLKVNSLKLSTSNCVAKLNMKTCYLMNFLRGGCGRHLPTYPILLFINYEAAPEWHMPIQGA
jgi:hypothetical protein